MILKELTGFRIKKMRNFLNLKQKNLAKMLDVSQTTINKWENAKQEPSIEKLNKLAKIFNVDTNYLTGTDKETIKTLQKLKSEDYIYSFENKLDKESVNLISNYIEEINALNNEIYQTRNLELYYDIFIAEEDITNTILKNEELKYNLFNIDYIKETKTDYINKHIQTYQSEAHKECINLINQLSEGQALKLSGYIERMIDDGKQNKNKILN